MRRADLEHVIRAAADAAQDDEIVIIGSQAILAQFPDAPAPLLVSQEADLYPLHHPERAADVDGALGDGSPFHETFGYYAHGVGPETAKAPAGWQRRLVEVRVPTRAGTDAGLVTGWCMEAHDLVLAKCAAGRVRDWEFAEEAIRHRLVEAAELRRRATLLPLPRAHVEHVRALLDAAIERAGR